MSTAAIAPSAVSQTLKVSIVIQIVAKHYNRTTSELLSDDRGEPLVTQRQLAMYLARVLTRASYPFIARCFRRKHHRTVIHAVGMIEKRLPKRHLGTDQLKASEALFLDIDPLTQKIQLAFTPTAKFQPEKA